MTIKITDLSEKEHDLVKGIKKVKAICPHCKSKNTELMLAHYPIRIAIFICNSCNGYFEKYFEMKEEK